MTDERQTNYTIAEGYTIPSNGLIYDKPVNPNIELRSMTARDEMKRLSPSSTPYKTLAEIIEGCMLEKPAIHVYDMAIGDYEFLLHRLRVVTYGDEYNLGMTCPYCDEPIESFAHLNDLDVKEFDQNKFDQLKTFTLPKSGKTVSIKFQTPHMLDDLDIKVRDMKRRAKGAEINFEVFALLLSIIDTVDGVKLDSNALERFVNTLPAMDMNKILNNLDELNKCIGIDNTLYLTCDKCGAEVKTFFRFGTEFFRPTNI